MNHAGLYIHIPFCQTKCGYCSFNSVPANRKITDDYLESIHTQARMYNATPQIRDIIFDSIFFGGGTPTLASAPPLHRLLHTIKDLFQLAEHPEISIEANPNSISPAELATLQEAGFNRLSFGVQSFQDELLAAMERTHTGNQAKQAINWAIDAGFTNINSDLIYGLPGQTTHQWQDDLHTILALEPDHLSLYELSIEPGTAFHQRQKDGTLPLPDEDTLADMEDISRELLTKTYNQYEISNFAKPGKQCRHNLTYWQNGTYLGLGAGAVSCIGGERFSHHPSASQFTQAIHHHKTTISHRETLDPEARFRETIIMGLRLVQGVNIVYLEQQSELTLHQVYGCLIDDLISKGHLHYNKPYLRIPPKLLQVANQILHQLV